jgi:hypothetical protein
MITMDDLPGSIDIGCANCHSINHQTQQCEVTHGEE